MLLCLREQVGLEQGEVLDALLRGSDAGGGTFVCVSAVCLRSTKLDSENTGLADEDFGLPAVIPASTSLVWIAIGCEPVHFLLLFSFPSKDKFM
jgi:hypothetical protein